MSKNLTVGALRNVRQSQVSAMTTIRGIALFLMVFAALAVGQEPVGVSDWQACKLGPWGKLEKKKIVFKVPLVRLPPELFRAQQSRWVLPANSEAQLASLLQKTGLPATEIAKLTASATTKITAGGTVLYPSDDFIAGLPSATRAVLYALLGKSPANDPQHTPYVFLNGNLPARLDSSPLMNSTKKLIRDLSFPAGEARADYFADVNLVLRKISDPLEKRSVIETLKQFTSYQVRLTLNHADANAIAQYWQAPVLGDVTNDLPTYLSAMAISNTTIPITDLISPFARIRLHSYPTRLATRPKVGPDCFWTAANFFSDKPDDAFFNPEIVLTYVQSNYQHVTSSPKYGDIVFFVDTGTRIPIHAAIYLADDLMFTKNGYHYWTPWTINSQQELEVMYSVHNPVRVQFFRRKK